MAWKKVDLKEVKEILEKVKNGNVIDVIEVLSKFNFRVTKNAIVAVWYNNGDEFGAYEIPLMRVFLISGHVIELTFDGSNIYVEWKR